VRRYSTRPLPPYRYVPGEAPHPTRDPDGHSFGAQASVAEPWRPEDWRHIPDWLWAVDLFNHGYWWESHEALEALWHAAGRTTPPARFVQALVHLSAACLNRRRGHAEAARHQAARAVRGLRAARAAGPVVMGLDVEALAADVVRSFSEDGEPPVGLELELEGA
jgi:hypothetical protein